jgi:hypothetical protein
MMGARRHPPVTRFLLVAALILASLWAGAPAGQSAADPDGRWVAAATRPGTEAAVLRDRGPALAAPADRPGPGGPLLPVLLGLLVASVGAAAAARALGSPWPLARRRTRPGGTRLHARAPPLLLQPV